MASTEGNLVGDVLLCSSFVTYAGTFNAELRQELTQASGSTMFGINRDGRMALILSCFLSCFHASRPSSTTLLAVRAVLIEILDDLQDKWLPDIKQRNIPHSGYIDPLDMLADDSTKVSWLGTSDLCCCSAGSAVEFSLWR